MKGNELWQLLADNGAAIVCIYLLFISIYAAFLTVHDKKAAQNSNRRVPEKKLFGTAIVGGAAAMYIAMKIIRHKTKHKRFMIGLPLIITAQAAAAIWLCITAAH